MGYEPNTNRNKMHKRAALRKILNKKRKKEHGTIGTNAVKKKLRRAILKYKPIDNIVNLGTFDLTEGEKVYFKKDYPLYQHHQKYHHKK